MTMPAAIVAEARGSRRWGSSVPLTAFILVILATLWSYAEGLHGPFLFDDFPNIVENNRITEIDGERLVDDLILASLSTSAGPLKRPISMLSFGLNYHASGMNPFAFKVVNLLIHLLNGAAIFCLCAVLLRCWPRSADINEGQARLVAGFAAAIWLLHPMQVSSVLYVVQRMTELATLFTLCGLICYAYGRERGDTRGLWSALAGLLIFGVLAALSKESGLLIFAYALVIELSVFNFAFSKPWQRQVVVGWFIGSIALPALAGAAYLAMNFGDLVAAYRPRDFSLAERLLTQSRILWQYLGEIALPLPSRLGLYHDEIQLSTSVISPGITLPALVGLLGMGGWALWNRRTVAGFAVLWFLVGHAMESTLIPLELKFEHRNYLSMLGIILFFCWAVQRLLRKQPAGFSLCLSLVVIVLATLTHQRSEIWKDSSSFALSEAANHPKSARANYQAGLELIQRAQWGGGDLQAGLRASREYFSRSADADPLYALGVTGLILSYVNSPAVPADLVTELARRLRAMRNPNADAVKDIVNAQVRGQLALSTTQVLSLMQAILENTYANQVTRATILNKLGEYHFNKLRDPQTAVSLTIAATEEDPENPLFRINLASLALALNRPDIAAASIARAESLDRIGLWAREIADVNSQLAALKAGAAGSHEKDGDVAH